MRSPQWIVSSWRRRRTPGQSPDVLRSAPTSVASRRRVPVLAGDEWPRERAGAVRVALALVVAVRQLRQRSLALDDPEIALAVLLGDELVQAARLLDVLRHVRRKRRRHLADTRELDREARLADRLDDALRVGDELRLAQPARRHRRADEPF